MAFDFEKKLLACLWECMSEELQLVNYCGMVGKEDVKDIAIEIQIYRNSKCSNKKLEISESENKLFITHRAS